MKGENFKKWALITGGSSGIGLEMARSLSKRGFHIVLTARGKERLEKAAIEMITTNGVEVKTLSIDLAQPDAPEKIYNFCKNENCSISVLVNNAGYAISSAFDKTPMEEEEKFIRVLGIAVIALTKLFLSDMLQTGEGKIAIVSSVAAFAPPSAIQPLYGPIKTFVNRFSEGINKNYNSKGITSTAVCPGYTITNFHTASGVQNEMDRVPAFMKKSAQRVAEEAVKAILKGKKVCVPTTTYKLIVFLLRTLPHALFPLFSRRLAPGRYNQDR